jgi:hypothetical protein
MHHAQKASNLFGAIEKYGGDEQLAGQLTKNKSCH